MLYSSIRNRMFTSRNLKKCALVCTTCVQQLLLSLCNFFRSCAAIVLVSTGTHLMYTSLALRYRENAVINKEQTQTKYSDVINFHSIIAGYCCLLDPPPHCPGQCFAFLLWMTRSKWSTSPGTFVFDL